MFWSAERPPTVARLQRSRTTVQDEQRRTDGGPEHTRSHGQWDPSATEHRGLSGSGRKIFWYCYV